MALNAKQKAFCDEYIIDFNATQAAIRAGYSEKTSYSHGQRLLNDVEIQKEISKKQIERSKRTEITQDRVLLEIARLAFNDPRKAFDGNNALLPVKQWPDEVAAAISSIKTKEITDSEGNTVGISQEVKFWDKSKNLDLAARHLGMLNDKLELGGSIQFTLDQADQDA